MDSKSDQLREKVLSLERGMAEVTKELQEKNRALEVENALEQVRVRAMAMQSSSELKEVIQVVFEQVVGLGINTEHAGFILNYKDNDDMHIWLADKNEITNEIVIPYFNSPHWNSFLEAKEKGRDFFANHLNHEEKNKFYRNLFKQVPDLSEDLLPTYLAYPALAISTVLLDNIGLYIENFDGVPYTDEENKVLMRFGKVFQQTYTRFLDLKKAEAQTREAQIEAALERVRAASMTMHKSQDLHKVINLVYNQLVDLGLSLTSVQISDTLVVKHTLHVWLSNNVQDYAEQLHLPITKNVFFTRILSAIKKGESFFTQTLSKQQKDDLSKHLFENSKNVAPKSRRDLIYSFPGLDTSAAVGKAAVLTVVRFDGIPYLPAENEIIKRFGRVFDQSYTRFLDLQKAEAQTREAQIEAALERVRSTSMAMHDSKDLHKVIVSVYNQLVALGLKVHSTQIVESIHDESGLSFWNAANGQVYPKLNFMPYNRNIYLTRFKSALENRESFYSLILTKRQKDSLFRHFFSNSNVDDVPKSRKDFVFSSPGLALSVVVGKQTALFVLNYDRFPYSNDENGIIQRFAHVFEQTYARFLDLQKAEKQGREAQIEAALERIRSRSMAMFDSEELGDVASVLYKELIDLGISNFFNCGFIIVKEDEGEQYGWITQPGGDFKEKLNLPYPGDGILRTRLEAWKAKEPVFLQKVGGKTLSRHLEYVASHSHSQNQVETIMPFMPDPTYFYCGNFSEGYLHIVSGEELGEEAEAIIARLTKVFQQAYTRFLDLKKAEAHAREAQIEASLERVRSRSLAMRGADEFLEVAAVVYEELKKLRTTNFDSCGVNIYDEEKKIQTIYNFHIDLKMLTEFQIPMKGDRILDERYKAWKRQDNIFYQTVGGKALDVHLGFAHQGMELDASSWIEKFGFPDPAHYHFGNFAQGYLHIISSEELTDENKSILGRFAKVFEQAYTRVLDLQKAEVQAREAQIEAALEKVRSKSLAMHKSEELGDLSLELVKQVQALGVDTWFCAFNIYDEDSDGSLEWGSNGDNVFPQYRTPREGIFLRYYEAGQKGESLLINEIGENECAAHYEYLCTLPGVGDQLLKMKAAGIPFPTSQIDHVAFFKYGYIIFITYEETQKSHDVFMRFAKVFEQSYARFLDLKKAEAQARESQIELALERVRSRSMAMHKSLELSDIVALMFKEMEAFGFATSGCELILVDEKNDQLQFWLASPAQNMILECFHIPRFIHPLFQKQWKAWKDQIPRLTITLEGQEKTEFNQLLFEKTDYKRLPEEVKEFILNSGDVDVFSHVVFKQGLLEVVDTNPLSEEMFIIIHRFATVFEQAYTRFLDLKKAEAQAREAQIEAALERVRSKTMAMHSSEDVSVTVITLFDEVLKLGLDKSIRCGIGILQDKANMETWSVTHADNGEVDLKMGLLDMSIHPLLLQIKKTWENEKKGLTYVLEGKEVIEYYSVLNDAPEYPFFVDLTTLPNKKYHNSFCFNSGVLFAFTDTPISDEATSVLKRFAGVFNQTYTRFLDLQKAEAQAREAQIEAALERVRSKTMAMHKSEEMREVVAVLYKEVGDLGISDWGCNIQVFNQVDNTIEIWLSEDENKVFDRSFFFRGEKHVRIKEQWEAWRNKRDRFSISLQGNSKISYDNYVLENTDFQYFSEKMKEGIRSIKEIHFNFALMKYGYFVGINQAAAFSDSDFDILSRFAIVFDQSYTRFLDLQKAEAQTRESQIEAALERVRSKAMAMRSSKDIGEATTVLFKEIEKLGMETMRCGILIIHENKVMDVWTTSTTNNDKIISVSGQINMTIHPLLEAVFDGWKRGVPKTQYELAGKDGGSYYQAIRGELSYKLPISHVTKQRHFNTCFMFNEGALFAFTKKEISESAGKIYNRFAKVFGLTYQRYRELIESEKREKETNKQSSLDRVRGEIASMRSTEDLNRITPIIWQELTNLGVPFFRCGIFIVEEEKQNIQVFLSDPSGKSLGLMNLDFATSELTKESVSAWREGEVYKTHWNREEFVEWTNSLKDLGKIETREGYQGGDDAPETLDLHFVPFTQGMLYVGNLRPLDDDQIELVKNLSESFSIAYSRYEDFTKLEKAKEDVEQTLKDLKATQKQLIQSEKMASLGELTAGIAHEIQNPLNFVNNFSELSNELIDEMNEEIEKGDLEEAKFIAKDIKQNLEKINHHGQRASSIVKGMLDHSRSSSGEKVLTDINQLTDEYLRLSYHGLRAKDRTFNAKYETSFGESLPKINVVPQDIGRVILNLINNAFYAVNEKLAKVKATNSEYQPTVFVSTRISGNDVVITVKDNGNGIPKKVVDKIFQPFFTTKPTGQGTGLGLSLSYDIVKAHGGELSVDSLEGENSSFQIQIPIIV
jgi:signal transduction histidine kinase/endonuclease IV